MMPISVVVVSPVHNRKDETLRCLRSLFRSERSNIELRVIIVDDGSTDGSEEAIRAEFPSVEIVRADGTLWYTAGTNLGIKAALEYDPDYVLAINNDSIFDPNCLDALVRCAEQHEGSVVGSLLLNREIPHKAFQIAPRWRFWRGGIQHWHNQTIWSLPETAWEVELIVGNCVLYPATAIRDAGLMDERHLPQYGDAEYTPRMRRKGWKLFVEPKARVFCKPNDYVSGFRHLSFREKIYELFFRHTGPYSLKRRVYSCLGSAPNPVAGVFAVPVFYARVLLGINGEGSWGLTRNEKPLKDVFVD